MTDGALGTASAVSHALDTLTLQRISAGGVAEGVATFWSTAARGGAGWAATSVALGLAGGTYRRAAAEGLAAWAAAEATASALKTVTTRRRPPRPRGRGRTRSSSLPSSHTAAGVAYAVAAGTRAPVLAAPLGLAALIVAWSRIENRLHYPSDVLAGGILGVAVGGATAVLGRRVGSGRT